LQETHFTSDLISKITSEFDNWKCYHSYGESNANGCSIIISNKINFNIIDSYIDTNGRYVLLNIEALNNVFSLLNMYATNDKKLRTQFFEIENLKVINYLISSRFEGNWGNIYNII